MKKNYKNLILALAKFNEDWWIPYRDSIGMLSIAIQNGMISRDSLIDEFTEATKDSNFNWKDLARESQLLIEPENYLDIEIKNYVKFLIQDYLFPDRVLADSEIIKLEKSVEDILKWEKSNDGWVLAQRIFDDLQKQPQFRDLEYYNLWKLPFLKKRILQKYIDGKEREIGYLKFNG